MLKNRAYTLIELTVVMACMAVITGITLVMMFQAFDFYQRTNEQMTQTASTNRLIAQFREDARSLGTPTLDPAPQLLLQWKADDGKTVNYRIENGEFPEKRIVVRDVMQEDQRLETESYHLTDDTDMAFFLGEAEFDGFIALSLWKNVKGVPVPEKRQLNPWTRSIPETLKEQIDPQFAGNWRTIIVKNHSPLL